MHVDFYIFHYYLSFVVNFKKYYLFYTQNKGQSSINKINKKVITNLTGGVLYSTKYNEIKQDKKEPKNRIAVCPANFMIKG